MAAIAGSPLANDPDPLADTARIAVPAEATRVEPIPTPTAPSRTPPASPPRDRRMPSTATILLATAVIAAALLLSLGNRLPGAAPASPSASSALPSPTTEPSPTTPASPSPTPDPAGPALTALGHVVTTIDAAKGGHDGLNGKTAGELLGLVDDVRRALESEDFEAARAAANRLSERWDKSMKGVDKQRAQAITDAIAALIQAIPT
jgi:hypothetical protein